MMLINNTCSKGAICGREVDAGTEHCKAICGTASGSCKQAAMLFTIALPAKPARFDHELGK